MRLRMRDVTPHLGRRLALAQPFIDGLAQEIVLGPGQKFDLGDQLGPHPMWGYSKGKPPSAAYHRTANDLQYEGPLQSARPNLSRLSSLEKQPFSERFGRCIFFEYC